MEMMKLQDPAALMGIGDTWYELAGKERSPLGKSRYGRRAVDWYERAKEKATGLLTLRIDKRLQELYKTVSPGGIPITKGLVGAWNLEEGKGTRAQDASGRGHHGVLTDVSPTAWVKGGRSGRVALEFDGMDDHVKIDADSVWNSLGQSFTIAAWIYKRQSERFSMAWMARQIDATQEDLLYFAFIRGGRLVFAMRTDAGLQGVLEQEPFLTEKWIHIALTYDGSALTLYRNGEETQSNPAARGTMIPNKNPITIGGNENSDASTASDCFAGRIARVRIYNRTLTVAEIAKLAKNDR